MPLKLVTRVLKKLALNNKEHQTTEKAPKRFFSLGFSFFWLLLIKPFIIKAVLTITLKYVPIFAHQNQRLKSKE